MPHMIVTVNKLNRRSAPVTNVADKSNILDVVTRGFSFNGVDTTNNSAGTWYRDDQNFYYWGGGVVTDTTLTSAENILLNAPAIVPHDMPVSKQQCSICAAWLKNNFEDKINGALAGTPFTAELVYAIACQETAYRWYYWINTTDADTLLARCVFDASGDFPDTSRDAFPKNRQAFQDVYGSELTQMLVDEGNKMRAMPLPGFPHGYAPANYLYKGYGIFQYDLQNIQTDKAFFTDKLWYSFDACMERLLMELNAKWKAHPNDMFNTVRSYNGSGPRAEEYAQRVSQFYNWLATA